MSQGMSRRLWISSRMLLVGFVLFAVYSILAAVFREQIAVYQYGTFTGEDLQGLAEATRHFAFDQVLLASLMGAGLSICCGGLVWLGLTRRLTWAFLAGLVGGSLGLVPLMTVHIHQASWIMFIADNACLIWITLGLTIGMREIPQSFRTGAADR